MPEEIGLEAQRAIWRDFFKQYCKKELLEIANSYPDKRSLLVSYKDIELFDSEQAARLLERPNSAIFSAEQAIRDSLPPDFKPEQKRDIHFRVKDLPPKPLALTEVRELRSKHIGKMVAVRGLVRKATQVRPKIVDAVFQCVRCLAVVREPQGDSIFKEPLECYRDQGGCGKSASSTRFVLLTNDLSLFKQPAGTAGSGPNAEGGSPQEAARPASVPRDMRSLFIDTQKIEVQESPEGLRGGDQPERLTAYAEDDLCKRISPGDKVVLNGTLRSHQKMTGPVKSTFFDWFLDINSIELEEHEFEEVEISPEEEEQILKMSKNKGIYRDIVASIAPTIYGMDLEKEALALQMFGGVAKIMPDGTRIRGDAHVLLIGDPGTAKSQLLRYVANLVPRGIYASGKSSTAAGLTAAAVHDEFGEGRWTLEAGALVLADKGLACLVPQSRIVFNNSVVPISSLFDETKKRSASSGGQMVELCTLDGIVPSMDDANLRSIQSRSTLIRRKWYDGKVLTIGMRSGFSVKLTPDHRLLDGNSLEWRPAGEMGKGGSIVCPLKLPGNPDGLYILDILPDDWIVVLDKEEKNEIRAMIRSRYKTLRQFNDRYGLHRDVMSGRSQMKVGTFKRTITDFGVYHQWKERPLRYGRGSAGERLKISKITPELAYFLGFAFGDGTVRITKKHSSIQITQAEANRPQVLQLKRMVGTFSRRLLGEYKRVSNSCIRGRKTTSVNSVYHMGSNLIAYLYRYIASESLARVLKLDDDCLRGFVAGAMDSDGCVSIKKGNKIGKTYETAHIEFLLSRDEDANHNFMLALRRMDCYSRLIKGRGVDRVRITGRNDVAALVGEIGNYSVKTKIIPGRITNISSCSEKAPMKPVMDICDSISMLHTPTLLKKGIWSTIHDYKSGVRRPSKVQLQKIKNGLCGLVDKDLVKRLGTLAARDYFLDELISVTEEEYHGYVYDLYVPSHHNFVSDGVLVHNCIDELDKMSEQDSSAMHEAMEQQQISVAKAGITATLQSRCAILAAANPKEGRFDEHSYLVDQINLAPTLLSRFDVIFPLTDKPDKVRDAALAAHITNTHLAGEIAQYRKNVQDRRYSAEDELEVMQKVEPIYKPAFLRKYIAYAKSRIFPVMTKDTMEVIREYYVNIRAQSKATEGEGGAVPMTPRQVEALIRLSEASARVRLSNKVTTEDAERAKKIVEYFLRKVASEGGRLDIDAIMTGTTHSQRERIHSILDIVEELDEGRGVTEEEILRRMSQDGVPDEKVRRDLERLHNEGRLFNPTSGRFKVARERR